MMVIAVFMLIAFVAVAYIAYRHRSAVKTGADKFGDVAAAVKDAFKGKQ